MDNETSKTNISRAAKLRVFRECTGILLWLYVFVKLFVFDLDIWVLDQFSPGLGRVLHYKVFAVIAAAVASWMVLGRKQFSSTVLYIVGYPLIVLFWRLPVFAFRRWPLILAFAPVIYRAVATFPTTFLFYTLAILSGLIILISTERALLVPAMVGLAVFLSVHLYRGFRDAYSVSIMAGLTSFLRKIKDSVQQGAFDHAAPPVPSPPSNGAQTRDPSSLYLLRSITEIVIDKVGWEVRSRKYDLYLILSWLYTLGATVVVFSFEFLALRKMDPSAFGPIVSETSFWEYLGFSLGNLPLARISGIVPVSHAAIFFSYLEVGCTVLIFFIFVFTVLTAARETNRADMDDFSAELRSIAEALDRRVTEVYRMTLAEVEMLLLRDKADLVNGLRKARGLAVLPLIAPKPAHAEVSNGVAGFAQTPAA